MNLPPLVSALGLLVSLGASPLLVADNATSAASPPLVMPQQYSADVTVTTKHGTATDKSFIDDGKIRSEMDMHGEQMVAIIRPDQQKVYEVLLSHKMVMQLPYDADKLRQILGPIETPTGTFDALGTEMVNGAACLKYKVTTPDHKTVFYWVDPATKAPVKMASADGSFTIAWSNYKAGPQDPALFEPPAGYPVMDLPAVDGSDGGSGF